MKHVLLIINIATFTISLFTMEIEILDHKKKIPKQSKNVIKQQRINIINDLPAHNIFLPPEVNLKIDISDGARIEIFYNTPYNPDQSTISLAPQQNIKFAPRLNNTLQEHTRLGMNNKGDGALIQLYVHAALNIEDRLIKLYIGKYSSIKFGDTISFKLEPYKNVIGMYHNAQKLKEIKYVHVVETIGCPKDTKKRNEEPLLWILSSPKK